MKKRIEQTPGVNGASEVLRTSSDQIRIAQTAVIDEGVRFYGAVSIGSKAFVGPNSVIGYPWEDKNIVAQILRPSRCRSRKESGSFNRKTIIGPEVWLYPNCVICTGAKLGRGSWFDVGCFVGERTVVGNDTWVHYGARIYNDVLVGSRCNIGGFICNRSILGEKVTLFGALIHRLDRGFRRDNDRTFDDEPSPIVGNDVFIGWGTLIVGGIRIGEGARIDASSIITKDIKPGQRIPAGGRV